MPFSLSLYRVHRPVSKFPLYCDSYQAESASSRFDNTIAFRTQRTRAAKTARPFFNTILVTFQQQRGVSYCRRNISPITTLFNRQKPTRLGRALRTESPGNMTVRIGLDRETVVFFPTGPQTILPKRPQ